MKNILCFNGFGRDHRSRYTLPVCVTHHVCVCLAVQRLNLAKDLVVYFLQVFFIYIFFCVEYYPFGCALVSASIRAQSATAVFSK